MIAVAGRELSSSCCEIEPTSMRKMIKVFINALLYATCVILNVVSEPDVKVKRSEAFYSLATPISALLQ